MRGKATGIKGMLKVTLKNTEAQELSQTMFNLEYPETVFYQRPKWGV